MPTMKLHMVLALALLSPGVMAQQDGDAGPPPEEGSAHGSSTHHPSGPPPEAYTACNGKSAGSSASITLRDGKVVQGTCEWVGDRLAARMQPPSGIRGGGPRPDDAVAPAQAN